MPPRRGSHGSVPTRLHVDEKRPVEARKQTEHKLDMMRRYDSQYLSILVNQDSVRADHIFRVEMFAGAGRHLSVDHHLGEVPGTAVQACIAARMVQRDHPGTHVHVRLVDHDEIACRRLEAQISQFKHAEKYPDKVDVTVTASEYASQIEPILAETEYSPGKRYRSLWLFDPFGLNLPHASFGPLLTAREVEIIINLDAGGVHRQIKLIRNEDSKATPKMVQDCTECLNALFGCAVWETALNHASNYEGELESIARLYAETFPTFRYRRSYKLRSSDGQMRFLIHLTHSERAANEFAKTYRDTQRIGIMQGRALKWNDRGNICAQLQSAFAGKAMTLRELETQTIWPLDKQQAKTIRNHARDQGYASYDERTQTIHWKTELLKTPTVRTPKEERSTTGAQMTLL